MKLNKIIDSAKTTTYCEYDLDFVVLEASSRVYPPTYYNTDGKWSIFVGYYAGDEELVRTILYGNSQEEVVSLAKQWYKDNFSKAVAILQDEEKEKDINCGETIDNIATVDAVPVKHGHWINHFDDLFPAEGTQECSVCHAEQMDTMIDDNYCPNCGAKMDEVEDANTN